MGGEKYVQDSDEEDNSDGGPSRTQVMAGDATQITLSTIVDFPSSPQPRVLPQSGGPSTSSTELHERNQRLQEAYDVLAASSKSQSFLSSQPSSGSPTVSKNSLRRATTACGEGNTKRSVKTHGTKRSQDDSGLLSSSAGESQPSSERHLVFDSAVKGIKNNVCPFDFGELGSHCNDSSNESANRDGTAATKDDSYNKSKRRNSIDTSDSPPTSNFLQNVLVQQANPIEAPMISDTTLESYDFNSHDPRAGLDEYSKRMLDIIELSPSEHAMETLGQSGTSQTGPRSNCVSPDLKVGEQIPTNSSNSMSSPSKACTITDSKRVQFLNHDSCVETHNELSLSVTSGLIKDKTKTMESRTSYGASRAESNDLSGSLSPSSCNHAQPSNKSATTSTRVHFELDSDDADIGIPKEQYQPRPSRSRSGRGGDVVITPTDFSKRPEALVKSKKSKRRKTTAFERKKEKLEDEDWQAEGSLASAIKPMKDDRESNVALSTLEESIEAEEKDLDENVQIESKSKPTSLEQKKSRGRPRKQPVNDKLEEHAREETNVPNEKEPLNPIENFERLSTPAPDKRSHKHKLADQPEQNDLAEMDDSNQEEVFVHPPDSIQDDPAPALTPALTKRGRKRKITEEPEQGAVPTDTTGLNPENPDNLSDNPTSATSRRKCNRPNIADLIPLVPNNDNQTIDLANPSPLAPPPTTEPHPPIIAVQQPLEEISTNTLLPSPIKSMSAVLPQTPSRTETTAQKGPDKHSPLNSGKMAYRVGLSRRQRIPPLLRVVRK
ncbi:MAG: hypothetical protein Q9167_005332 [Letrouitia subvulpina]